MRGESVIGLTALCLCLSPMSTSGCSKKGAGQPATPPQAPAAPQSPSSGDSLCKLIPENEILSTLGIESLGPLKVKTDAHAPGSGITTCNWGEVTLMVEFRPREWLESFQRMRKESERILNGMTRDVAGVGDAAYTMEGLPGVYALKGTRFVSVSAFQVPLEKTSELTRKYLARW